MNLRRAALILQVVQQALERRAADDRIFDEDHPLAFEHLAQGGELELRFIATIGAFDEGATDVAVANQPFHAGDAEFEGHRIRGRLPRIGHRHDHGIAQSHRHAIEQTLLLREFLAELRPRKVDAAVVQRAGHVREVNPLEEAVALAARLGELMHAQFAVLNQNHVARFERLNLAEADVLEGDAFAGRAEHRTFVGPAHRPQASRIAQHHHVAHRVQEHDVVRAVELLTQPREEFHPVRPLAPLHLVGDVMHDHFGVVLARQMVLVVLKELIAKGGEVRELAVESEGEPLPLATVLAFERLGIPAARGPACGVPRVPDRSPTRVILHDAGVLRRMVDLKRLDDRAEFLVRIEEQVAIGVEAGHTGGELAAVLEIEEHPRHVPGEFVRVAGPDVRFLFVRRGGQIVKRRHTAFVVQLVHVTAGLRGWKSASPPKE